MTICYDRRILSNDIVKFMDICVFGDSIAYGYFDLEKGGWVNRVRIYLDNKKFDGAVYNLGISGEITGDILKRFEIETTARDPKLIIFAVGINDAQWMIKEKQIRVALKKFEKNIKELINKARNRNYSCVFVGFNPVDEEKTSPIPWRPNIIYKNDNIRIYNDKIKEICEKENIKFIDLYGEMMKIDYRKMLYDGLHPNAKGHEWIANEAIKYLNVII